VQTLRLVAALRLPFRALDNIEFRRFIKMAALAPSIEQLRLLGSVTARSRLDDYVAGQRQKLLELLPPGAKISLAIDGWTSPNKLHFLAILG
jgi:hypothetical protein